MKKSFFLSILAVGALVAGCAKSEVVDTKFNEEISFETYLGRDAQTKAAITSTTGTNGTTAIANAKVYGFYTGTSVYDAEETVANLWEDGLTLSITNGVVSQPTGNDIRYWANATDNYTFLAYSPSSLTCTSDKETGMVNPTISYTVDDNLANQIDVLYSTPLSGTKQSKFASGVQLAMQHALSRVTVKASATDPNFKFDVKEVTLSGDFYTKGTLELASPTWEYENADLKSQTYSFYEFGKTASEATTALDGYVYGAYTPGRELSSNPIDYSGTTTTGEGETATTNYGSKYLMILPRTFTEADHATLRVVYTTFYMGAESGLLEKEIPVKVDFQAGNAYSLNLVFTHEAEPIHFSVTVDTWVDATGQDDEIKA